MYIYVCVRICLIYIYMYLFSRRSLTCHRLQHLPPAGTMNVGASAFLGSRAQHTEADVTGATLGKKAFQSAAETAVPAPKNGVTVPATL